jgi:hypothetical protein
LKRVIVNNNLKQYQRILILLTGFILSRYKRGRNEYNSDGKTVWCCCGIRWTDGIKLTNYLHKMGINILGTSADSIDMAEDRERFEALWKSLI